MGNHKRITIRSAVKSELKQLTLKRGGWIAASGALMLLIGGTFIPLTYLKLVGIPLFFAGLVLISIGWLPYRKLQRLETKPHELQYDGQNYLFLKEGKPLFRIPETSIEQASYVENENIYGLGIWLKKPAEDKVAILQRHFTLETFAGCDLFLPYFTKRTLTDLLEQDHAS